jgi:hypothetical protein
VRKGETVARPRSPGLRFFYQAMLMCFLLSIYTEVPLFVTDAVFVPSFVTLLLIAPILGLMFWNITYKYEVRFVASILLVLLMSALLSPGFSFIEQKLLGLVQAVLSIIAGVLLVKLLDQLNKREVGRTLLILSLTLVVGAALEVFGVLREASDVFRNVAYANGGYNVYDGYARDLTITGFERPKFFTSEPSLLAIGFLVFTNAWLLVTPRTKNYFAALSMTTVLWFLCGSPILLVSAIISTAIIFYSEKHLARAAPALAVFLISAIALLSASPEVLDNTIVRFDRVFDLGVNNGTLLANDSLGLRLVLPFITLVDVLTSSPLFGVGISGKEVADMYSRFSLPPLKAMGNNNVAAPFLYLGVIGSALFAWAFSVYLRRSKVRQLTLLMIILVGLSMSMGGFESPRFWGNVFLFIGTMKMRSNQGISTPQFTREQIPAARTTNPATKVLSRF